MFAKALETPGGLKIQTIHGFCNSILRKFPLETNISPNFKILDDRKKKEFINSSISIMFENHSQIFEEVIKLFSISDTEEFIDQIFVNRSFLNRPFDLKAFVCTNFKKMNLKVILFKIL